MKFSRAKGCYDIYSQADEPWKEPSLWSTVENVARRVAQAYGLHEIRTPYFEYTDVFLRSAGETSDIVSKEMYTFEDKGGRSLTLRPEITAPVIRAFIENSLYQKGTTRLWYYGPCWRYDRAQKGRYRQFTQFGIEILGVEDVSADVEAIASLLEFYRRIGLKKTKLLINSIGNKEVRDGFINALREYFTPLKDRLSEDSQRRLTDNPMRIIDSKEERDIELGKGAPKIYDFLTEKQKDHFAEVQDSLKKLEIDYTIEPNLVRGLDYYCDTVFEVVAQDDARAQSTIGAGGRYNGLIKEMGGPDLPGVGFATGIERILQNVLDQNPSFSVEESIDYYFIPLSETCKQTLIPYLIKFRQADYKTLLYQGGFNIKKGLTHAEKAKAKMAIILGEAELQKNKIIIKNLLTREEEEQPFAYLDRVIKKTREFHGSH